MRRTSRSRPRSGGPTAAASIVDVDAHAVDAAEHLGLLAQRHGQPVALEVGRAQLVDERAQLVEGLAGERLQPGELRAGLRGLVAVEQRAGRLGGQDEREELLADDVVELDARGGCARRGPSARGACSARRASAMAIAACAASRPMTSSSSGPKASAPTLSVR